MDGADMQLSSIFNVGTGVGAVSGVVCGAVIVAVLTFLQAFFSFGGISSVVEAPSRESVRKLATFVVPPLTIIGAVIGAIIGS